MFGIGILFLLASIITALPKDETYYRKENVSLSPLLLSDIRMMDYVSLPVFEGMEIKESAKLETGEGARREAYEELLRTAEKLASPENNCTFICDITISRDKRFLDKQTDYSLSSQSDVGKAVAGYLKECPGEYSVRLEHVKYLSWEEVNLDIDIKSIYAIPSPVTNAYVKEHTQYNSFSDMVSNFIKNTLDESRDNIRQDTIANLLDYAIQRTTFMELPESLYNQEFDVLKKDIPEIQFEDAKRSLKRIFFIGAVADRYQLADEVERIQRVLKYQEENSVQLTDYEKERMSYLMLEDDVNNYIYKLINITEKTANLEE